MNSTVESINNIYNILNSVDIPRNKLTQDESINNLDKNIQLFNNLKEEYSKLLKQNIVKFSEYDNKLKNCKKLHSKDYFNKKIKKYKDATLELVNRIANTDKSIENLDNLKQKIIKGIDKKEDGQS